MPGQQPFGSDRLVEAYDRMLERIHQFWKEEGDTLARRIEQARDVAVELNELSREEAEKIGVYLRRDLEDAARFVRETDQDFRDWFRFDLKVLEQHFLGMLEMMVDQTRAELDRLAERAQGIEEWHTGEVTGAGSLHCSGCGREIHMHRTGRIPPCAKCHGTVYRRFPADGVDDANAGDG